MKGMLDTLQTFVVINVELEEFYNFLVCKKGA